MHEVRVESLDKLESLGGEVWISANSGDLSIVFSDGVWEEMLSKAQKETEPDSAELEELGFLKRSLGEFARDNAFELALRDVPCGGTQESEGLGFAYDLVLKSPELYSLTTGYLFTTVVEASMVERVRAALGRDGFVEQAYAIGAVADEESLNSGDENLKVVSVRGRKSTASRFEMAPELWRTLFEKLGWSNVQTVIPRDTNKG